MSGVVPKQSCIEGLVFAGPESEADEIVLVIRVARNPNRLRQPLRTTPVLNPIDVGKFNGVLDGRQLSIRNDVGNHEGHQGRQQEKHCWQHGAINLRGFIKGSD